MAEVQLANEYPLDLGRANFVDFVHRPDHGDWIGKPKSTVEALEYLAVVELDDERADLQLGENLVGDARQLGIEVQRDPVRVDHVDVALRELAVASVLRALTTPHLLDLVTLEREVEVVEVLGHVAGEGDGQVEVQSQPGVGVVLRVGLEALQPVDLLRSVALLQERVQ